MSDAAYKHLLELSIRAGEAGTPSTAPTVLPSQEDIEFVRRALSVAFDDSESEQQGFLDRFLMIGLGKPEARNLDVQAAIQLGDAMLNALEEGRYSARLATEAAANAIDILCVKAESNQVRRSFLPVLRECAQNNIDFQDFFATTDAYKNVIKSLKTEIEKVHRDFPLISATILAVSAVVRSSGKGCAAFLRHNGPAIFTQVITRKDTPDDVVYKAARSIYNMYNDSCAVRDSPNNKELLELEDLEKLLREAYREIKSRFEWSKKQNFCTHPSDRELREDIIGLLQETVERLDEKTKHKFVEPAVPQASSSSSSGSKKVDVPSSSSSSDEPHTSASPPRRSQRAAAVAAASSISKSATKRSTSKKVQPPSSSGEDFHDETPPPSTAGTSSKPKGTRNLSSSKK